VIESGPRTAKVRFDDILDDKAPDVCGVRWNMSALKAYQLALYSEQKAFAFYDKAILAR
jgi:hypothetical protein